MLALVFVAAQPIDLLMTRTAVVCLFAVGTIVRTTNAAHFANVGRRADSILANFIVWRFVVVEFVGAWQLAAKGHNMPEEINIRAFKCVVCFPSVGRKIYLEQLGCQHDGFLQTNTKMERWKQ